MKKRDKKAAIELTMGTIVILVLAMSMLILGLVLVRTIFTSATTTVDVLDDQVKSEITKIFGDNDKKIVVKLGSDNTARIKANNERVGVAFGARTIDGSTVDIDKLKYELSLDIGSSENCVSVLNRNSVEGFISQKLETNLQFDEFQGDTAFSIIQVLVPEGTPLCSQKVFIDVSDNGEVVGRAFFIIEVIRKGIF